MVKCTVLDLQDSDPQLSLCSTVGEGQVPNLIRFYYGQNRKRDRLK